MQARVQTDLLQKLKDAKIKSEETRKIEEQARRTWSDASKSNLERVHIFAEKKVSTHHLPGRVCLAKHSQYSSRWCGLPTKILDHAEIDLDALRLPF